MREAQVAVVKGEKPESMVRKALSLIRAEKLVSPKDRVLIKPNYISALHPSTGVTTDPRVVEALIEFLEDRGVGDIVVGEGGAGDTERAFDVVEIRDVVARHGVGLRDLNDDERLMVRIPGASALKEVGIAKTVMDRDCVISVPSLKVHHLAVVTLCMKNLMGAVLPKSIMHSQLDEKLVDLASLIRPRLNVIDGIVGCEVDEVYGRPVRMGVVIAGEDMVAVDAVGAAVMGIDPGMVRHLQLAEERGLGVADLSRIEVLGNPIEAVQRPFELPSTFKPLLGRLGV